MLSREENELLCRVGPETPMGRMMRRYWLPIAMSTELAIGAPKRVRLLGENYVAYRGEDGTVGFLDELCPHRGASLVLARTEGCALRCIYHGWLVDRDGAVLEMPAEPEGTAFTAKVRQPSYAVHEHAGLVWAYVGPAEARPPVPDFAFGRVPASHRIEAKHRVDCNWTQAVEGAIDSAHSSYLHSDDIVGNSSVARSNTEGRQTERPSRDGRPRIQTEDTPYGFCYAALRKPIVDPELNTYARITHFIAPFTAIIPLGQLQNVQMFCPIDDEHTYHYNVKFSPAPLTPEQRRRLEPQDQTDGDYGTRAPAREQLASRPRSDEDEDLHRHRCRAQSGHGRAGEHGPDLRPQQGASRGQRHRDHPHAPAHARFGARLCRRVRAARAGLRITPTFSASRAFCRSRRRGSSCSLSRRPHRPRAGSPRSGGSDRTRSRGAPDASARPGKYATHCLLISSRRVSDFTAMLIFTTSSIDAPAAFMMRSRFLNAFATCAASSSGALPVSRSPPPTPPVITTLPTRDASGMGLSPWRSPSISMLLRLLMRRGSRAYGSFPARQRHARREDAAQVDVLREDAPLVGKI